MDPRVNTWGALDDVESADLNQWQDLTREARTASDNNNLTSSGSEGSSLLRWQADTQLTSGTLRLLDDSADWRDRRVAVTFTRTAQTARVGQSGSPGDTAINDVTSSGPARSSSAGYTGIGAVSNITTAAGVSNGNPPLNAVGANRSYAITVDDLGAAPVYLYCDPTTGHLYLYNDSGSSLWPLVEVDLSGKTGMR
jgi:hypothetical protein